VAVERGALVYALQLEEKVAVTREWGFPNASDLNVTTDSPWNYALLVADRRQISFDLLYRHVPPAAQRVIGVVRAFLVAGLLLAALPGALGYIAFLWRERTPVLLWRLDHVYACFGLFMIAVILRLVLQVRRLLGRAWRAAL
jgi:hypothetical protein